jgi:poly(A) polymerase
LIQRSAASIGQILSLELRDLQVRLYRQGPAIYAEQTLLAWGRADAAVDAPAWLAALTLPGRWTAPKLPVGGTDIIALGVQPGPRVGRILTAFEGWWTAAGFPADPVLAAKRLAEITHVN